MKNFKSFQTGLLTIILAGILLLGASHIAAQKSNFAGSWTYSTKNEAPENGFKMGPIKMVITQDELNLNTERTYEGRDGENMTSKEVVTLDGKNCENTVFQNIIKKSVASWSEDGKTLTIHSVMTFDANGEPMEMKSAESWKLSDDSKQLMMETSISTPNGDMKASLVYEKSN